MFYAQPTNTVVIIKAKRASLWAKRIVRGKEKGETSRTLAHIKKKEKKRKKQRKRKKKAKKEEEKRKKKKKRKKKARE